MKRWFYPILFIQLLAGFSYVFPRWADPNQNSRLDMVVAVVDDHTFRIDNYVANTVDYAKVGNHYYGDKAPGAAFLAIPIYAGLKVVLDAPLLVQVTRRLEGSDAFRATLRAEGSGVEQQKIRFALAQVVLAFALAAVPTALLCMLIFLLLGNVTASVGVRLAVTLGYGLLTPAFAYANAFYGHQLSAALLFGAFFVVMRRQGALTPPHLLLVGLLLSYSVVTEYPAVLMAGVLFLYTLVVLVRQGRWRGIGWVCLSGGLVAVGWMAYNNAVFGGPLELGYGYSALWVDQHDTGFMSLTGVRWDALWGITFSRFRGLFVLSPWLLLCMPGVILWWRAGTYRAEWWAAVTCTLSMLLFNASSVMWWGGYAVGPRYLLPALPFMAFCAAYAIVHWPRRNWFRWLAAALLLWSFVAVWGLTLAEQAFPPDYVRDPLVEYAWPNWLEGNVARNMGTLMGLEHGWSVLPVVVLLVLGIALAWITARAGIQTGVAVRPPHVPASTLPDGQATRG